MGTWGYEPKDNDGTWDYLHDLDAPIAKTLRKCFKKKINGRWAASDRWSRVGLVQILLERGFAVPLDVYKQVLEDLDLCANDKEWLTSWNDSKRTARVIKFMRAALVRLAKHALPARPKLGKPESVLAPNGWPKRGWGEKGPSWTGIERKTTG